MEPSSGSVEFSLGGRARGARRPGGTAVARLAGVSQKTVSRVFNNEPNVSEDTRNRVLTAARQLGYRPNGAARALLTGRTYRIGVVSLGAAYFGQSDLLVALEQAARGSRYTLSIANTFEADSSGMATAAEHLLAEGVDAIILSEPIDDHGDPLEVDVPVLMLGTAPAVRAPVVLSVHASEGGEAAAAATGHLLGLGHATVHHIAGPWRWWAARERKVNWQATLAAAGAEVPEPLEGDWSPESGYRIGRVLARDGDVTAVFAANDEMAIGAVHALHEAGRRVPEDVSVIGFDDIPVAAHITPPLTTFNSDNVALADASFRYLTNYLTGPGTEPAVPPRHKHKMVIRNSTAPRGGASTQLSHSVSGQLHPGARSRAMRRHSKENPNADSRKVFYPPRHDRRGG
ncbi:MAG: LacI family DNA-binding transcriptional regulator, partial [Trebonia sp.]